MFGGVNVWRIAEVKEIGEIKFGQLIDFIHKDAIYMLNFGWLKFGQPRTTRQIRQIRQTFPLYGICISRLSYCCYNISCYTIRSYVISPTRVCMGTQCTI